MILNFNGKQFLNDCMDSVMKSSYDNFEVILVDNASTDGSIIEAIETFGKDPRMHAIVNQKNLGYAAGNNEGLRQSNGEFVVFLNNDTKVTPMWLVPLVSAMLSDPMIGVCQSKILLMGFSNRLDVVGSFLTPYGFLTHVGLGEEDDGRYETPMEIFSAKGACMMVRKKLLEAIGPFDSEFISFFEETDLCWRVWLRGYKVCYVPASVVFHAWGGTISQLDETRRNELLVFYGFRNRIASQVKNLGSLSLFKMVPIHVALCSIVSLWFLRMKRPQEALLVSRAVMWNILSFGSLLRKRRMVQDLRSVSDGVLMQTILRRLSIFELLRLLKGTTWKAILAERKTR